MPLRDDLLNPIAGDNPSGANLRYEKVYDQIKEARTEDDDTIPTGAWARTAKKADYNLVIKLGGEALANKSKDLQLAAWLAEAHVKKEGIGLIQPCLKLFQDLQEQFWETLYPEIDEDGDAGMRATPIEWASNRVSAIIRESPITRDGLNYFQYKESRAIGYEADAQYNDAKTAQRQQAIDDGKPTAEEFDKSFNATPKTWYVNMEASIHSALETLEGLQVFCEDKYGDDGPAFGKLRTALEEVGQVVTGLLNEKRKTEPDAPVEEEASEEPEPEPEAEASSEVQAEAAPVAKAKSSKSLSAEPVDREDAFARIQACANFLQKDNPSSPVAYMLQAALRFAETRETGSYPAWDFLAPPATEKRQNLKRLASESNWSELLAEAIAAAGEPCGRGWLDVQRYIWRASYESSYSTISAAVISMVQGLIKDVPEIPTWTMSDDTPTANPETQKWLEEMVIPKPPEPVIVEVQREPEPEPVYAQQHAQQAEESAPDILDTARELMARGHLPQALQLLMRDAAQQPSGRARFQRRLQMAQLCVGAGQGKVAYPVLDELVKEIDQRQLEEWEATEMIAPPLALLLKCLDDSAENNGLRESVFNRLCRIDPIAAMDVSR